MVPSAVSPAIKEELWFGGHDNSVAESNAARSMAALVGKIVGAKPFPESARRLADLTRSEVIRIEPVVQVLERDPALSARLLRLVNSAGYALRQRCTSVRHAATLVGTDRLHQIATTAAVLDMFDVRGSLASEVLEHSTVTGAISRYLGAHLSLPVDDLFTAGFLHDIGKVMLLETEGDQYVELLTTHRHEASVVHVVERSLYGFDHAVLAAHVLTEWNIPDPVPKLVAWHHDSSRSFGDSTMMTSLTQTLRLADLAAHMLLSGAEREDFSALASAECASYLDISEPQLASMWDDLHTLCEASIEQCRGDQAPALEPRSMRPRQTRSPQNSGPPPETDLPLQFPCVVCAGPTFGNTCRACGGNMCPQHHVGRDDWCSLCARDFGLEKAESLASLPFGLAAGIAASTLLVSAAMGYESAGWVGSAQASVGTFLLLLLTAMVLGLVQRWLLRVRFLRTRPNRRVAGAMVSDGGVQTIAPSVSQSALASASDADPLSELIRLAGDGMERVIVDDVPSVPTVLSQLSRGDHAASLVRPPEVQITRMPSLHLGWQPQTNSCESGSNRAESAGPSQLDNSYTPASHPVESVPASPSTDAPDVLLCAASDGTQSAAPPFAATHPETGTTPTVAVPTLPFGVVPPAFNPRPSEQAEPSDTTASSVNPDVVATTSPPPHDSVRPPISLGTHPLAAIGVFPASLSPQRPQPLDDTPAPPLTAPSPSSAPNAPESKPGEQATLVDVTALEFRPDADLPNPSTSTELAAAAHVPPASRELTSPPQTSSSEDMTSRLARELAPDLTSPLGEELKARVIELVAQRVAEALTSQLLQSLTATGTLARSVPVPAAPAPASTASSPTSPPKDSKRSRRSHSKH